VSPSVTTFLFEVVNFLILAGVLSWLLFRPVRNAIAQRRSEIAAQEDEAAKKLADAERSRTEIEQRLAGLDEELRQQREQSKRQADQQAEQIVQKARADAQRERDSLKRQLQTLEEDRIERVSEIVADVTGQAVGQLLQNVAGTDLQQALVRVACDRLRAFEGNSLAPVVVESARELSAEQRESIQAALEGNSEPIDFRVSGELHLGLRVTTNRGLIDVSDVGLTEYTQRALAAKFKTKSPSNSQPESHGESS